MEDSYSFDVDDEGRAVSYQAHRAAYARILSRLGFDYRIVSAVSGAMSGSTSREFLAPTAHGEDPFVHCESCDHAADTEAVPLAVPTAGAAERLPEQILLDTPDTPTIGRLVTRLNELVEVMQAEPADMIGLLVKGYIGPQTLAATGIRLMVDPMVVEGSAWVNGANEPDKQTAYVVRGHDFAPTVRSARSRSAQVTVARAAAGCCCWLARSSSVTSFSSVGNAPRRSV